MDFTIFFCFCFKAVKFAGESNSIVVVVGLQFLYSIVFNSAWTLKIYSCSLLLQIPEQSCSLLLQIPEQTNQDQEKVTKTVEVPKKADWNLYRMFND